MERLWERSREERKETNSEAEYENRDGTHEKSGGRERGNRGSESGDGHRESSCEAEPGSEGKEEQRLSSQNPKLKRTKESENSGGQKAERKRRQAVEWKAQRRSEAKAEDKGEPGEAAAEIDAGGRRKEIADEAIRETACVEAERLKPPFHEEWKKKAKRSRSEDRGFFVFVRLISYAPKGAIFYCLGGFPML